YRGLEPLHEPQTRERRDRRADEPPPPLLAPRESEDDRVPGARDEPAREAHTDPAPYAWCDVRRAEVAQERVAVARGSDEPEMPGRCGREEADRDELRASDKRHEEHRRGEEEDDGRRE